MTYNFKALTDAWTVIYDDLGHNEKHELSDFLSKTVDGSKLHATAGISIRILEPQNCIMYSAVRKAKPSVIAKHIKLMVDFINSHYTDLFKDSFINKYSGFTLLYNNVEIYLTLINGKLNAISNLGMIDGWSAFPYVATKYIIAQMFIAKTLDVDLGWHQFNCFDFHINESNFVTNHEQYNKSINDFYLIGKEGIPYFKYFDSKDYRITLDELISDSDILLNDKIEEKTLKNECMRYLLNLNSEVD